MDKRKPVVGETIYSLNVGNATRNCEQVLTPVKVLSVGRKYFVAGEEEWSHTHLKYFIDDWREHSNYSADSLLYESDKEYYEEKEKRIISREIAGKFTYSNYPKNISIEDFRKIIKIINQ